MILIQRIITKIKSQLFKLKLRNRKIEISLDPPASGLDKETILKKVAEVPFWWHTIELGHGVVTPGHQGGINYPTSAKRLFESLKLPESFKDKSVLDIGAWDGAFSFEAERRGARKVLAIDNFYRGKGDWTKTEGFEVAKEILNSRVEFQKADVYDLCPEKFGIFDVVIFPGVFYHLKHPILALERVASVCKEMLIMETHYDPYHGDRNTPLALFYKNNEVNDDVTTWWGFNEACLHAALRSVGFKDPETVYRYADRIGIKAYK